jgi:hypothetical protein
MPSIDTLLEQEARNRESLEIGIDTSRYMPRSDYRASYFDNKEYNVTGLSYPQDVVDSREYGGNKVIFYINVSVDSRVFKAPGGQTETVTGVERDMRGALVGNRFSTGAVVAATSVATAASVAGLSEIFRINTGSTVGNALAGGAISAGSTALIASNVNNQEAAPGEKKEPTFSRPQKRLKAAVALYVPNQLSVRYSAGWGEEDTMALSAFAQGGEEIKRAFSGEGLTNVGGLAQSVLTSVALDKGPFGTSLGIASGLAANPKKEQAFKNVDFRSFTFDYQFAPRSSSEAKNMLNIIRLFKYHMHPEFKDETGFLYIYPSEFDIVYYKGARENLSIHRHSSCVLTEMNVNYTPNGIFTTFEDGTPTQINLSMTFRELMLMSKETIEKYA